MSRVLPTAPGWWWMRRIFRAGPGQLRSVEVIRASDDVLVTSDGPMVTWERYEWLEPIPAPGEVEALRADLRRIQGEAVARGWEIDRLRADLELATLEVEALRRQVAELTAHGVSLHKAEDRGRKEERAAIVAWLRKVADDYGDHRFQLSTVADNVESGTHEEAP